MFRAIFTATVIQVLAGCGLDLTKSDDENKQIATDDTGNLAETQFSANNSEPVSLAAPEGSELFGANITFPTGALKLDTVISIGEGASIANDEITLELGIEDNAIAGAGPAVVFDSTADFNADEDNLFTLQLPITSSFALAGCDNLVVVYKQKRVQEDGTVDYYVGLIREDDISLEDDAVVVKTRYFGSYQAACSEKEIKEDIEAVKTAEPIVQKIATAAHIGSWQSGCFVEEHHENGGGDDGEDSAVDLDTGFFDNPDDKAEQIIADLGLNKDYFDKIDAVKTDRDLKSQKVRLTITKDAFVYRQTEYYGSQCEIAASSIVISGTYELGADVAEFEDTKEIDVTFQKYHLRTISKDRSAVFRYNEVCGADDWGRNRLVEITKEACPKIYDEFLDGDGPGTVQKSLIQVKGDTLRLGEGNSEESSERDKELSSESLTRIK